MVNIVSKYAYYCIQTHFWIPKCPTQYSVLTCSLPNGQEAVTPLFNTEVSLYVSLLEKEPTSHLVYDIGEQFANGVSITRLKSLWKQHEVL